MSTVKFLVVALVTTTIPFGLGASPALAETVLRWKFKEGERISYVVEEKQARKMTSDREVFDLTQTLLLDTTWTVKAVDRSGKAEIGVTIDRVRFQAEGKGAAKLPVGLNFYDSGDMREPKKEAQRCSQHLKSTLGTATGVEFTLRIDSHGRITDVMVPDKVVKALATKLARELAGFFGNTFTADGLKEKLTDWVVHFPVSDVSSQKTWTDERSKSKFTAFTRSCTYQGPETRDGNQFEKIGVRPELAVQREPDKAYDKITAQEGQGVIYFDNQNGRLVEYTLKHKVASESYVVGRKFAENDAETTVTVKLGKAGATKGE
jgi:Family of unknown function (DUF6263)